MDDELGLVYYNYRHLNPTDGRWINRDPIQEQGGWNLYAFIRNRINIEVDLLGKIPPYNGGVLLESLKFLFFLLHQHLLH